MERCFHYTRSPGRLQVSPTPPSEKRHAAPKRSMPQTVKKPPGGVGGPAGPLTVIVSGGFAAGAGRFRLSAENFPYPEERPGGPFRPDQRRSAILEKVPNALFRHAEACRPKAQHAVSKCRIIPRSRGHTCPATFLPGLPASSPRARRFRQSSSGTDVPPSAPPTGAAPGPGCPGRWDRRCG